MSVLFSTGTTTTTTTTDRSSFDQLLLSDPFNNNSHTSPSSATTTLKRLSIILTTTTSTITTSSSSTSSLAPPSPPPLSPSVPLPSAQSITMPTQFDSILLNIVNSTPSAPADVLDSDSDIYRTVSTRSSMLLINYTDAITNGAHSTISPEGYDWIDILVIVIKVILLSSIIIAAIFGNLLVIIAVCRHHKLRITTNYFIVSLACADILVALFAMTFNASVAISGRWLFNNIICDFWNSCDVLFSTASIMHLSCISYDRYYAIIKPLDYPMKITTRRVMIMITFVWISSAFISYIPIFTGLYTTEAYMQNRLDNPDECIWEVNIPYALVSSTVSFWLPCGFMLAAYYQIYKEAIKQENFIYKTQQMAVNTNANHYNHQPRNSTDASAQHGVGNATGAGAGAGGGNNPESGSSTPTKRTINKMKREHKAAKTLGIIMGMFILCWLPFFIWYVVSTICGQSCPVLQMKIVVDIMFWIGYLNSAMNPVIYAYFNREFREAFKETLRNIFCCCLHLQCLEGPHSDAIHFNCTYRSTQEIGLVENKYVKD